MRNRFLWGLFASLASNACFDAFSQSGALRLAGWFLSLAAFALLVRTSRGRLIKMGRALDEREIELLDAVDSWSVSNFFALCLAAVIWGGSGMIKHHDWSLAPRYFPLPFDPGITFLLPGFFLVRSILGLAMARRLG